MRTPLLLSLALPALTLAPGVTPSAGATQARIDTIFGAIDIDLLEGSAPGTVQNFLNYATSDRYDNSFFHRLAFTTPVDPFVLQGGGFTFQPGASGFEVVPTDPPIVNEFGVSNTRGTLAMAKTAAGPDSATSQWFFNLSDNSANLDNQNGGFTVFATVLGNGMDIVDQFSALPRFDLNGGGPGPFGEVPLVNPAGAVGFENLAIVNSVDVLPETFVWSANGGDWFTPDGWNATIVPISRDEVVIDGVVNAAGSVVVADGGSLLVGGPDPFANVRATIDELVVVGDADARVRSGRLDVGVVSGRIRVDGGTLAVGLADEPLEIDGTLDMAGGTLEASVENGELLTIEVSMDALLGGELRIVGDALDAYETQVLLDAGFFRSGNFGFVDDQTTLTDGLTLAITYAGNQVLATAALGADANLDRTVNLADFAVLGQNFGGTGKTWATGDFNGDNLVNLGDFAVLGQNFGRSLPASSDAATAAVPEPATALLLAPALALLRRR